MNHLLRQVKVNQENLAHCHSSVKRIGFNSGYFYMSTNIRLTTHVVIKNSNNIFNLENGYNLVHVVQQIFLSFIC